MQLKEYTHPRIGKIVSALHAQVYWLTQCKQQALDLGDTGTASDFSYAEAVARKTVRELDALDQELAAQTIPAAVSGEEPLSLLGDQ